MVGFLRSNPFPFSSLVSDFEAIARALRHCGQVSAINRGKSLHSKIIKHGIFSSIFVANNLMAMYLDFKLFDEAQGVFDEMPDRNVVSWTALISAHARVGNPHEALRVFTRMLGCETEEPNGYTFSAALKACAIAGDLEMGKWIHDRVLRGTQFRFDTVLVNAVLDMYVKCGSLEDACRVFDGGYPLNSTSWNTMISGYANGGNMVDAEDLFRQVSEPDSVSFNTMIAGFALSEDAKALHYVSVMHKKGLRLDHFTFPSALNICGGLRSVRMGEQVHDYIVKSGCALHAFVGSSLIDMYSSCGYLIEARRLFEECSKCRGSISDKLALFNSMVSAFVSNGHDKPALDLVSEIHSSGLGLDAFTLSSALKACSHLENVKVGHQVHALVAITGYQSDQIVGSVLISLYALCGKLEDSLRLFHRLPRKDLIAWTGLITGCVQQGSNNLAFCVFRDMLCQEIEVDHFVVSSTLKACACLPWPRGGEQVHAFCIKGGFESENFILTSLIDMYSKCGSIEDALRVFETVDQKDTVCWTGMIIGCGCNGRATEAIELFQNMIDSGEKPNEVTILGVLSACRHAGLVGEACSIFNTMREAHGIVPSLEHYCCMVDILSRDGRFEEAKEMVSDMPYKADKTIRNSLRGASMIHQNADVGAVSCSPCDVSGYATMSNIYASLGRWGDSAKLRQEMRKVGVKEPGQSWIEVGD